MLVSVVVPCFDEEDVIEQTHARLVEVTAADEASWEFVYVDDGSLDRTPERLAAIQRADARVRVVRLSRNFGHQVAITAGIEHSAGDAIVIMDADLQDPPEVILELVDRWRQGSEVVYARRTDRAHETRFKLLTAKAFYRLLNRMSDTEVPLDAGDFRLLDRRVAEAFLLMPERDRFVRGMVSWLGFRQTEVPFRRAARAAGRTKYPFWRMLRFALDAILSFSFAPLRLATFLGFAASVVALVGMAWAVIVKLTGDSVQGWTSVLVAVLFIGGVQLIAVGIIGEYVGRIYREVKRRPLYVVSERLGFEDEDEPEPVAPALHADAL